MKADIRRAVEKELYSLRRYRVQLKNLQLDLIDHPQPELSDGGRCNLPGDPTGVKAAKHADIKNRIALLSSRIEKIENALSGLTDEDRALIELRYLSEHRYTNVYVIDTLVLSSATYYERRNRILSELATLMWPCVSRD